MRWAIETNVAYVAMHEEGRKFAEANPTIETRTSIIHRIYIVLFPTDLILIIYDGFFCRKYQFFFLI